jgi:hypothetical protein
MLTDNYEAIPVWRLQDIDDPSVHDVSQSGAIFGSLPFQQVYAGKWHGDSPLDAELRADLLYFLSKRATDDVARALAQTEHRSLFDIVHDLRMGPKSGTNLGRECDEWKLIKK